MSPNQIISRYTADGDHSGYTLFIHPDFLLSYPLASKIRQYGFFSYSADELLYLSESEKNVVTSLIQNIAAELRSPIDGLSQDVVISQIELLLTYSNRFYQRQFITRRVSGSLLLTDFEKFLEKGFAKENILLNGLPSVSSLANKLHISSSYLSDLLREMTGQSAQQHIQDKLIDKAKENLAASELSISEIAYGLGFGYPQSFTRLFRAKTKLSPQKFRSSFQGN